ncbi:DUF3231 family protein [Lederbergia lenta]|uniref:Protein of uncharacterized function (DUF3231) n=1 Tax=Lederbergia lenta TaxID=1467 RepID=A0A2X4VV60_LEDLE|nr:DUF3231 family protein [Lederbergia lenta]MCM3112603.1 DUF3231 family protein [Lederbergia lenta]MEC2323641.1 DUF3231 family protein [Lederbergia lenta]SQI51728.1 Protein of uncharacterised function (DUF3231) [Lederbergia lenta]
MTNHDHIKLTSSELSVLFGLYMKETLAVCVNSYFLEHVETPEIRSCLEYSLNLSESHIVTLKKIYHEEDLPTPTGFTEQDVNTKAPRLFSDEMILHYVLNIGIMGLTSYSVVLPSTTRNDIRTHVTSWLHSSTDLFNRATNLLLEKGLYIRPPYIPYPKQTEFVNKQHFLAGWIGEQRPLTSNEISLLFMNLYRNTLGGSLLTGFSQIAQSKEVRKFMTRGTEIAKHHSAIFSKFLAESNLATPVSSNLTVTTSQEPVFSDKLLMFHTDSLNNAGIGFYGQSLAGSPRRDLATAYSRLLIETGEFVTDGAQIMISNGWLEKPPSAPDRKDLAKG